MMRNVKARFLSGALTMALVVSNAVLCLAQDPYANPYEAAESTNPYEVAENPYAAAESDNPYEAAENPYAAGEAAANPYASENPYAAAVKEETQAPATEETVMATIPEAGAKYVTSVTEDGWVLIENEGGESLGLSPNSGVGLIEDDGFAFKDLNKNGELDTYEDWRLTAEERAENLVGLMAGAEAAAILSHGG